MAEPIDAKSGDLFNRDHVLSQIDSFLSLEDGDEKQEKTSEFIADRLKFLTESTTAKEFSIMSRPVKGFLHPESNIRRNFIVDPFNVDDPEIYKMLLNTFGEFRSNPNWQGKTLREIAPYAILRTLGNYFGNHWATTNTEGNNRDFYLNRSGADSENIHLNEFKGKAIAVCAEKASVAQNLLSFLGYESELVASSDCRLESEEQDDKSGHMYNVITSGENHLIFDPANPTLIKNTDGSVYSASPAFYLIDQPKYDGLMRGGKVQITHNDGDWDGKQTTKGPDQIRIYGGPSKNTFI